MKLDVAEPTIRNLRAAIERLYDCRQGIFAARCQTSQMYETLHIECSELEGGTEARLVTAMQGMIEDYITKREAEIAKQPGTQDVPRLYWRFKAPYIFLEFDYDRQCFTQIRTRLALANGPEVFPTAEDYEPVRLAELQQEVLPDTVVVQ